MALSVRRALLALGVAVLWGSVVIFVAVESPQREWFLGAWAWIPGLLVLPLIGLLRWLKVDVVVGAIAILVADLISVEFVRSFYIVIGPLDDMPRLASIFPFASAAADVSLWVFVALRFPRPSDAEIAAPANVRSRARQISILGCMAAVPIIAGGAYLIWDVSTFKQGMVALDAKMQAFSLERLHVGMSRADVYALTDESSRVNNFTFSITPVNELGDPPEPTRVNPHPEAELRFTYADPVVVEFDENDRVLRWWITWP
jgi:hypothetical protein